MDGHPGQPLCAVRLVALADYVLGVVLSCCQLGVWGLWSWLTEAGACFRALAPWLVALARILFEFFLNSFRILFEFFLNYFRILFEFFSNSFRILFEFFSDSFRILFEFFSNYCCCSCLCFAVTSEAPATSRPVVAGQGSHMPWAQAW